MPDRLSVLRAAEGRRMPWKNGGGETLEIAVHPAAADLDQFDWRVSLATITADGPFSSFPGRDRTLAVVDGDGLVLSIGAHDPVRLDTASDPLRFPADVACSARLVSGPVTDLNVMTRRSRFDHTVSRLVVPAPTTMIIEAGMLLVCCAGTLAVGELTLRHRDVAVAHGREILDLIPGRTGATAMLVSILSV